MGQISKIILKGTGEGELRMGEQRKPWNNNIKEWTGCCISKLVCVAEDRQRRCATIADASIKLKIKTRITGLDDGTKFNHQFLTP